MSDTPLTGGYGVVDISGLFGFAIRHFTHSQYDHAFIVLDAKNQLILEAQPSGAKVSSLYKYRGLAMEFSTDSISAGTADLMKVARDSYVGVPYGFPDIAYLGLELQGIKPRWLLDRVLSEKRMICSQLVAQFGQAFGTNWRCGQEYAQLVTPGMLASRIN